ncbi:MAG: AmmeMemoRadiSam system protein B [Planctomycetota bacterium]
MTVRTPVRAGTFYPAHPDVCAQEIDGHLAGEVPVLRDVLGGLAPHAGWSFSGPTAGRLFRTLRDGGKTYDAFLLFGAVHTAIGFTNALYPEGAWETPLGALPVDAELNRLLLEEGNGLLVADAGSHAHEHSVEVLLPFVKHLYPKASIAVLAVPPSPDAPRVGEIASRAIAASGKSVAFIASTDLTHYGASYYGFAPKGSGEEALAWVKEENDARIIERFLQLDPQGILKEASMRHSACGAGAAAAAVACARARGAKEGVLLAYTTSHDVHPSGVPTDFVGYAAVAFEGGGES